MRIPATGVAVLLALVALSGCTLWISLELNECQSDADCTALGPALTCVQSICVLFDAGTASTNPDCKATAGLDGPGSLRFAAVLGLTTTSGAADPRGPLRKDAITLAVEGLNDRANRSSTDPPYFVRFCDDHGSTASDNTQATALAGDGYLALISGGSSSTIAVSNVAAPACVPPSNLGKTPANLS